MQHTIAEPHISIRSSSNDEFNVIESNSNFHQTCNEVGDTSNHSINTNSFLTFNHDNSHANTSKSPLIGNEMPEIGEHEEDRDSYQNESYDGDDETTDACEEVGNFYCGGKDFLANLWDSEKFACYVKQVNRTFKKKLIALGGKYAGIKVRCSTR